MEASRNLRRLGMPLVAFALLAGCQREEPPISRETSPLAGPTSPSPSTVTPPPTPGVRVPDLVGRTLAGARRALRVRDLRPRVVSFRTTEYVPGRVVDTRPDASARRRPGARVTLYVAKAPPSPPSPSPICVPGYSPCITPGPDVDCAGGEGDGPRFVEGPVTVTGSDPYGLDGYDNDGVGCE
jgi:hypothetical protein